MNQKSSFILSFLLFATIWGSAQITVTNATFPAAGDSLKTATDLAPQNLVMTPSGGGQTWDFSALNPSTRLVTVFQPAAAGSASANFPGAELVTISDVGAEIYYDVSATAFSVLGISGEGLGGGFPIEADFRYSPPLVEREAPLNFFDVDNYSSSATISLPTSAIPGAIFDSLGIPTGLFDSIRVRITVNRLAIVDGFGTLTIPGGTYDVLRQKRTDYTSTGVDVHTFLGWVDIGTILGDFAFPTDTTITFNFLSNTAKEPIAVVTVDSTELVAAQVVYKDNGIPSAINPVTGKTIAVVLSPNPAIDQVTIELKNILPGKYTLRMFDSNGKRVLTKELTSDREVISIETLNGGIYFYNVIDARGQVVGTGKVMKVKG
jgi:hypothetical protein